MLASKTFFSFTEVAPSRHQEYNAWHQLDHFPENLALPGVIHGQRWVRSPDCAAAGPPPAEPLTNTHYVTMYWFRDPAEESFQQWRRLGEQSFQWGRRQEIPFTRRPLMGTFTPVKGYVNPRVRVSPDALPFRPNLGMDINVTWLAKPRGQDTHDLFGWYDREYIPELLSCTGAAGAWTFSSQGASFGQGASFDEPADAEPGQLRILLVFLDQDPLRYLTDRNARAQQWRESGRFPDTSAVETPLLSSVLRTITPWQWDWFD